MLKPYRGRLFRSASHDFLVARTWGSAKRGTAGKGLTNRQHMDRTLQRDVCAEAVEHW